MAQSHKELDLIDCLTTAWSFGRLPSETASCTELAGYGGQFYEDLWTEILKRCWETRPEACAKETLATWLKLSAISQTSKAWMKRFPLHLTFDFKLESKHKRWVAETRHPIAALSFHPDECPGWMRAIKEKDPPLFGKDSELQTLLNLPMSPNRFLGDPTEPKSPSCPSWPEASVTDEVPVLPPSLKQLSIAAKSTSACPSMLRSVGLDLSAVTANLPRLESLTVTAQCLFSEVLFSPAKLPSLRHFHICGAAVAERFLSRLPPLETASWAATVLASPESNRPGPLRNSPDFPCGFPGNPSASLSGFEKCAYSSGVVEAEYLQLGQDGVSTYIRPSLVAPTVQPRFATWACAARKVRLTSVVVGDDEYGSGVTRGVGYPHPGDLQKMCEGPCEELELVFQCTGMGYDARASSLISSWLRALEMQPVASCFHHEHMPGDVVAAPPGTSSTTTIRLTRYARCP